MKTDSEKQRTRRLTLAFIGGFGMTIALAACVTVRATKLGTERPRLPLSSNEVVVYRTEDQVPGPYRELALLDATSEPLTSDARVYSEMRRKAAAVGANAIILSPVRESTIGERVATLSLGMRLPRRAKATAIFVDTHAQEVGHHD